MFAGISMSYTIRAHTCACERPPFTLQLEHAHRPGEVLRLGVDDTRLPRLVRLEGREVFVGDVLMDGGVIRAIAQGCAIDKLLGKMRDLTVVEADGYVF